jgi:hypothetical protein
MVEFNVYDNNTYRKHKHYKPGLSFMSSDSAPLPKNLITSQLGKSVFPAWPVDRLRCLQPNSILSQSPQLEKYETSLPFPEHAQVYLVSQRANYFPIYLPPTLSDTLTN